MKKIRVGLVDDHRIVLEGLAQVLSLEKDIEVVFRCDHAAAALEATKADRPDVLVADVKMPGVDGIELLRQISQLQAPPPVVLLTASISDRQIVEAVRIGIAGIVLKEAAPRELVGCVRAVAAGEKWIDEKTFQSALDSVMKREEGFSRTTRALTKREMEIVRMLASGLRNKEIGERLTISEGTVKMHLHSIYEKLHVSGRLELTIYARDNGLV